MNPTLFNTVDSIVEQISHRSPFLAFTDMRNASLLAVFLLVLWVPLALLVGRFDWFRSHEIVLVQGIHIDADVLPHEPNSQGMREPADLERLAGHRTDELSVKRRERERLRETNHSSMSVSRITAAISESRSPRCERSLIFALPMMASRSSTIQTCPPRCQA